MINVLEILKAHLKANGYDGLVHKETECGCRCDDLAPCSSYFGDCEPGYEGIMELDNGYTDIFAMYNTKDRAMESIEKAKIAQGHNSEMA